MIDFNIGKPYSFKNYNCWDYVADIRKSNGIETTIFKPKNKNNAFQMFTAQMQKLGHGLTKVNNKQDLDIIIVRKGAAYHCGLIYGADVMHNSNQLKQVIKESFVEFIKPYESYTLWR